jgi:hypothetical protein
MTCTYHLMGVSTFGRALKSITKSCWSAMDGWADPHWSELMKWWKLPIASAVLAAGSGMFVGSVSATPVAPKCDDPGDSCSTILGVSLTPAGTPSGEAEEAQGIFLGGLTSSKSDGLTSAFNGGAGRTTFPLLTGTDYSATLTGSSEFNKLKNVDAEEGSPPNGRFDTTGDFDSSTLTGGAWWDTAVSFTIGFDLGKSVSAFGFYATDHGDFEGSLKLELTDSMNGAVLEVDVPVDVEGTPTGTLLFFGFADTKRSFSRIRFVVSQKSSTTPTEQYDYIGFDDFVTGLVKRTTEPPGVPEPGSLVLVAASLAALAATRRRRPR